MLRCSDQAYLCCEHNRYYAVMCDDSVDTCSVCSVLQDLALVQLLQKQLLPYLRASSGNLAVAIERSSRLLSQIAPAAAFLQGKHVSMTCTCAVWSGLQQTYTWSLVCTLDQTPEAWHCCQLLVATLPSQLEGPCLAVSARGASVIVAVPTVRAYIVLSSMKHHQC